MLPTGREALLQPDRHLTGIPAGPAADIPIGPGDLVAGVEDLLPMIRPGDYFLKVDGDSMEEVGLLEGMTVLIRPVQQIKPGSICAVWIDGLGGTLKRIYPDGGTIRLVAENTAYGTWSYPVDQVRVQGVVIASVMVKTFQAH